MQVRNKENQKAKLLLLQFLSYFSFSLIALEHPSILIVCTTSITYTLNKRTEFNYNKKVAADSKEYTYIFSFWLHQSLTKALKLNAGKSLGFIIPSFT